ncbi:MAG: choice-of-anchor E domain-containing protein [Planctomycetaceae bacterium]|nr:choice-of-anchor E domain-containing protein [Planctomycetaceae bacterium]
MNRRLVLVAAFAVVACAVGIASSANAESISGPFATTTPIAYSATNWTGSLSFPKFDSSLGTLTEVDLALTGGMKTVLTVENLSPAGSTGHANTHLQITVQDADGNLIAPQIDFMSPSYNFTLASNETLTSGTLTKSASSYDQYFDSAVLSEFTGPGTIVLPASTFVEAMIAYSGGNTVATQVTQAQLTGTVTYHYAAVPEPSTFALLLVGAVGLLVGARRFRG